MPRAKSARPCGYRLGPTFGCHLGLLVSFLVPVSRAAEPQGREQISAWRSVHEVRLAPGRTTKLDDFVLPVAVFDGARTDLGDLRLYDPAGREVPYALRVRKPDYRDESIPASPFNRSKTDGGAVEVTLDLGEKPAEHNEVGVELPGANFRRHARLEGSGDAKDWRVLVEKNLLHFSIGRQTVDDRRLDYPPSRFRYLRLRVERDPLVDQKPVELGAPVVRRRVEIPGEFLEQFARLGTREAVRADGGPGSAWIIELGGDRVPCEQLTLVSFDAEFARNYHIEAAGLDGNGERPFERIGDGFWRRRAGDPDAPLVADFNEVIAGRLKLVVTDFRNPPLNLQRATFRAAVREIVFADPGPGVSALRLYYGNPKAEAPQYDFARNLPAIIAPPPARVTLGGRTENPSYAPEPKPLTERWPWLIYLVLGAICIGLGVVIVSLARTVIRRHDALEVPEPVAHLS